LFQSYFPFFVKNDKTYPVVDNIFYCFKSLLNNNLHCYKIKVSNILLFMFICFFFWCLCLNVNCVMEFCQHISVPNNKISLCLNFCHLLAWKPNLENCSMYSNKFFHNFHLSESSFTCPRLCASGLVRRLQD